MRHLTLIDHILHEADLALRTIFIPEKRTSDRPSPAKNAKETPLTPEEKKHVAGLLRVNHAGEVCAQALYQGQALTAQLTTIKKQMADAAQEEIDHLAWCEERLAELNAKTSRLNFIWYTGSLMIGLVAGWAGDRISLGFVAETEHQVTQHLINHLKKVPLNDIKTKAILQQMQTDEEGHALLALQSGGIILPSTIKRLMSGLSKLLTYSSYYV